MGKTYQIVKIDFASFKLFQVIELPVGAEILSANISETGKIYLYAKIEVPFKGQKKERRSFKVVEINKATWKESKQDEVLIKYIGTIEDYDDSAFCIFEIINAPGRDRLKAIIISLISMVALGALATIIISILNRLS